MTDTAGIFTGQLEVSFYRNYLKVTFSFSVWDKHFGMLSSSSWNGQKSQRKA